MADAWEGQVRASSLKLFGAGMPRSIADWAILGALCCFLLVFLMPLYLMVVTGLKDATNVSLSSMWNLPVYLSGCLVVWLPVSCLAVWLPGCLAVWLFSCLLACPSVCLPARLFACLSGCLAV